MLLAYKAMDARGIVREATIEAPSVEQATRTLRQRGLLVTAINEDVAGRGAVKSLWARANNRVTVKDVAFFTRQLALMVSAATPLTSALESMEMQTSKASWRRIIADLRTRVEQGASLAEAAAAYPEVFDQLYRSIIAAGEAGGTLHEMLYRLSGFLRAKLRMRSTLIAALIYPSVLVCIAMGVMVTLVGFVLPRFAKVFDDMGASLPASSRLLIKCGMAARQHWAPLLITVAFSLTGVVVFARSGAGRAALGRLQLKIPVVGSLIRDVIVARMLRMFGTLMESGVALLDCVALTKNSMRNVVFVELLTDLREQVAQGQPIYTALLKHPVVPSTIAQVIKTAEESGRVGETMCMMADHLDEDNETVVRGLTSVLEPVILVFMGLVVGFIAISLVVPLFDLTSVIK